MSKRSKSQSEPIPGGIRFRDSFLRGIGGAPEHPDLLTPGLTPAIVGFREAFWILSIHEIHGYWKASETSSRRNRRIPGRKSRQKPGGHPRRA